jgi:transposase InsO family protein
MVQVPHGCATTTEATAGRYAINQKTVAKWKKRMPTADLPTGLKARRRRPCYPIRYVHIDIAEVRAVEGRLYLFVAIGPRSSPSPIPRAKVGQSPISKACLNVASQSGPPAFKVACARNNIDHRLTKPRHPWASGQVERMNRSINMRPSSASTAKSMTSFEFVSRTS